MRRRANAKTSIKTAPEEQKHCRDCALSYDWHSKNVTQDKFLLCRCRYQGQQGKYSILLSQPACREHFTERTKEQQIEDGKHLRRKQ